MHSHIFSRVAGLISSILLMVSVLAAEGATIVWINPNGGNWSVPANWSPTMVPGAADTALIGVAGTYTVTQNVSATISGLVVGADATGVQTLLQASGAILTLNGSGVIHTNGQFNVVGGLSGTGNTTIEGNVTWSGGAIAGTMAVSVSSEGALHLAGTAVKTSNGAITNQGTMRWSGGTFRIVGPGVRNLAGGLFQIENDDLVDYLSGAPLFVNDGTIRKTGGAGTTTWEVSLINNGVIDVQTGAMSYAVGSVFNDGSQFLGAGVSRCASGMTFNGAIVSENLEISGAANVGGTNTFSGTVSWLGGTVATTCEMTVATDGTLLLGTTGTKILNGRLNNAGTTRWTGGIFRIIGRVQNLAGGLFQIESNDLVDFTAGTPLFVNDGIIRKTAGAGTTTWEVSLHNNGVVDVQAGAMSYAVGSVFNNGTELLGAGINRCAAGVTFNGSIISENLELSGSASVAGNGSFSGTVSWLGGTIASGATLTIASGATLLLDGVADKTVNGTLINAGTMRWRGTGNLRMSGAIQNPGLFEIENNQVVEYASLSPLVVNSGTIRKTAGGGITTWGVSLRNSGVVDVQLGAMSYADGSMFSDGSQLLGAGINRCAVGTIAFNGNIFSENLEFSGTVSVSGTHTFSGTVSWLGGTLATAGQMTVATNSTLLLGTAGVKTVNGTLINAGTVRWNGGPFRIVGQVRNLAGSLFQIVTHDLVDYVSGSPLFLNDGTIRKTTGGGTNNWEVSLINSGVVDVQAGVMSYAVGSVFNNGSQLLGAGTNRCAAGVTFNGQIASENLEFSGTVTVSGTNSFSGTVNWLAGTFGTSSEVTVANDCTLLLGTTGTKILNGRLINGGTTRWTGGIFRIIGRVQNLVGGLFQIESNDLVDYLSGAPLFVNEGLVRKTAGGGTTTWEVSLINSGVVDVQVGAMSLAAGSTFNSGTRFTGAGVTTLNSGTVTLSGDIFSENLQLNGATVGGTGTFTGSLDWLSGTLAGSLNLNIPLTGVLRLRGVGLKTINGSVTNAGTVLWEDTGNLRLVGSLHNLASGLFEARNNQLVDYSSLAPEFVNEGLFRKTNSVGTTTFEVRMLNYGTIETASGTLILPGGSVFNSGTRFLGNGVTVLNAGTVTLDGDIFSENLQLNGATVNGSGSFTGSLDWLSGTLAGSLNLNIPLTGVLRLRGTGSKTINGTVTNAGAIFWEGTGNLRLVGSLHNLASGLFEARNDQLVDYLSGFPEFVNEGLFRKTNSVGTTTFEVRMLNLGIIDTATGTLVLPGGSVFNSGTRFTGSGVATLNAGTVTVNGDIFSENLQLAGATVTGAGSLVGSLDWLSGTLQAALDLTIPTNGTLRLRSIGLKTINGSVTNSGSIQWEGTGDLRLIGVLHNLASGVFEARNDELIDFLSGTPVLINQGIFRKAAGTNATTSEIFFRNLGGTVEVNSGTLSLSSGMTNWAGHVILGSGRLQLPANAIFRVNGGSLQGYGTMLAHVVNNNLVAASGSNGVLTISGNYTQAVTGTLSVGLGGLDPGTNHSWMRITGRASLDGTLDVALAEGFLPAISNTFQIATWTVNSGMFKCYNGLLLLGEGRRLVPEYHPGNLTLNTVEATEPQSVRLLSYLLPNDQVLICWPSEFLGHTLQSTTNLIGAGWTDFTNAHRVFLDPGGVEKYFRTIAP
jgi:hypothetical protein